MIKWVVNKVYRHNPECGWETYQSGNGKLHWMKKN